MGISGFVDTAEFAPTAEERVDAGRRDRLVLTRLQTDEVGGGEVLGEECQKRRCCTSFGHSIQCTGQFLLLRPLFWLFRIPSTTRTEGVI